MGRFVDRSGVRYDYLTALSPIRVGGAVRWVCRCDCGREVTVLSSALGKGSRSCGCVFKGVLGGYRDRRGLTKQFRPEYGAWLNMRARCEKPTHPQYGRYGGRGICVCVRWGAFDAFLSDMGPRPSSTHSLDRVDNDQGYGPDNCRWSTRSQQQVNSGQPRSLTDLPRGVRAQGRKFSARIKHDNREQYLGAFATIEEALKVRLDAEIRFFGAHSYRG